MLRIANPDAKEVSVVKNFHFVQPNIGKKTQAQTFVFTIIKVLKKLWQWDSCVLQSVTSYGFVPKDQNSINGAFMGDFYETCGIDSGHKWNQPESILLLL